MAKVFSQKHSSTYVGNEDIYSVSTDSVYHKWLFNKTECFAGVSWEGLTHETLAKTSCLHPIHHFAGCLLTSYPWKHFSLQFALSLHTFALSHTTLTNKTHLTYRVQKIEQKYNQIWHGIKANKNIVVNYNFTTKVLASKFVGKYICLFSVMGILMM